MGHGSKQMIYGVYGKYVEGLEKDPGKIWTIMGGILQDYRNRRTSIFLCCLGKAGDPEKQAIEFTVEKWRAARIVDPKRPSLEEIEMRTSRATSMVRAVFRCFQPFYGQNKCGNDTNPDYRQRAIQGGKKYEMTRIVPWYIPWQHTA